MFVNVFYFILAIGFAILAIWVIGMSYGEDISPLASIIAVIMLTIAFIVMHINHQNASLLMAFCVGTMFGTLSKFLSVPWDCER